MMCFDNLVGLLTPPQLVVLFVVFYPVAKFTTYVLLSASDG